MKDFYPFQILYLCCIPIGIKFNDCGLIIKLQNAFESLKLGLYRIMFLCVIFAQCDELKIMIFWYILRWITYLVIGSIMWIVLGKGKSVCI